MTNEEAITKLESLLDAAAECDFTKTAEAIQTAIEALRKQTAMSQTNTVMKAVGHCPMCEAVITRFPGEQFCWSCGQKMLWAEDN